MAPRHIGAKEAQALASDGAVLVDIREPQEFMAETIPGATSKPLSELGHGPLGVAAERIIFYCKSGGRTRMAAAALAQSTDAETYIMDDGIEGWKAAGFPVKCG